MQPLKSLGSFDPAKKAFSVWGEFKTFAFKGNVIDLAIGVVIGAAFAKIIDSLVKNIIMPLVSLLIPAEQSYQKWAIKIGEKEVKYGEFLGEVINFLVIAAALYFFLVKFLGWLTRAKQQEAAAPPPLTKEQELLTDIRNLLQQGVAAAVSQQTNISKQTPGGSAM